MAYSVAFLVDSVPFTKAVIAGETSLGGSESACLGLARALKARGHQVHLFVSKLAEDAAGPDVLWHPVDEFHAMNQFIEFDVVVALRWFAILGQTQIHARLRILWNEDLLVPGNMVDGVMACAWAYDKVAYVSDYHRRQWEDLLPQLSPLGWVTRNGLDLSLVPKGRTKDPNRIIHISRPERGLGPLLQMWPQLREQVPHATLQICRYSSMYDDEGWGQVCRGYDAAVEHVNQAVGGITYLGELTKPQLYEAISDAAVMWYPGVNNFAETSCIAALEAQACGTPFVGSYKGALPETAPDAVLIAGDAHSPEYQAEAVNAVAHILRECQRQSLLYRHVQKKGREHVKAYDYSVIAEEWEEQIAAWFLERYKGNRPGVLRQLLHEDDHVAARIVATDIGDTTALAFCEKVIAGKDHEAEHYASAAIPDPLLEADYSDRFKAVIPRFADCTRVLDVACGNGSFAIALAKANPTVHVYGLDYAEGNIVRAREGAERAGVADRCTFYVGPAYDFDAQLPYKLTRPPVNLPDLRYDGMFVGEFIEHVGEAAKLIDGLESVLADGAVVVYTCPHGACAELVPRSMPLRRGHVHRFHADDISAVWGGKAELRADFLSGGITPRGFPIGNWLISYRYKPDRPAGERNLAERIVRTRPLQKVTVGVLAKDSELDLGKCLTSVWNIAEEILVGDTGSTDATKTIAAQYGALVIDLAPIEAQPDGFAGARNALLDAASGDWFLWIDTDEQLIDGHLLRRYLDSPLYHGYVLRQHHLQLDAPNHFDIPSRIFRKAAPIRFYGCVHEQPQMHTCNGEIQPCLDLCDVVKIAHVGYLTDSGRRQKMLLRNLPLLRRDQERFPDRQLGTVLVIRDYVNLADYDRETVGGRMTAKARYGYAQAVTLFTTHFDDPAHKYHTLARPFYEAALQHLGLGWECEIAIAGREGSLGGRQAKPTRVRVRDAAEFERIMTHRLQEITARMAPVTFKTDPQIGRETPQPEPESSEAVPV